MRRTTALPTGLTTLALTGALTGALALTALVGTAPASAAVTCDGKVATIVAAETTGYPVPPVQGTEGNDVIVGSERGEVILGGGGDDTICALGGADEVWGGSGDDRLFGGLDETYVPDEGYYGDQLAPGPGDDYVDLGHDPASTHVWSGDTGYWDTVSFEDAPDPVTVDLGAGTATGEGTDTIVVPVATGGIAGSDHDDVLVGSPVDDFITGGAGDDEVVGGDGDDTLLPDSDLRHAVRGEGAPSTGRDVALGGAGDDVLESRGGADRLVGADGNDRMWASEGGQDALLDGGRGRDTLEVPEGGSRVVGGDGRDEIEFGIWPPVGGRVDGGAGRDALVLNVAHAVAPRGSRLVIDRPRGRVTAGRTRVPAGRMEAVRFNRASGLRVTYLGGPGVDRVDASGMLGLRAYGRGGDDVLRGTRHRDLLVGGPGRDVLDGSYGRDRCLSGERLRGCEVRR